MFEVISTISPKETNHLSSKYCSVPPVFFLLHAGHTLSGYASQFATQSYPCANQSQNASQIMANQSETGLYPMPVSIKGLWFEVPGWGGGPCEFWPAKAGSQQRFIKPMANILSIRYDFLNLYVI